MDILNACCFLRSGRMSWYRLATTALLLTCTANQKGITVPARAAPQTRAPEATASVWATDILTIAYM